MQLDCNWGCRRKVVQAQEGYHIYYHYNDTPCRYKNLKQFLAFAKERPTKLDEGFCSDISDIILAKKKNPHFNHENRRA